MRNRIERKDPDFLDHGKIPPQAVDLEEAVLGAIMLEKQAIQTCIPILIPEMFYKDQHREIMEAIVELYREGSPVDILTVTQKCKAKGTLEIVGGAYYITQLTNHVSSSANTEYHAHIIIQKYVARMLIKQSHETIIRSYEDNDDVFDILDDNAKNNINLYNIVNINKAVSIDQIVSENDTLVSKMRSKERTLIGIRSNYVHLDILTLGWQKGDLYLIAARPGMGKTAFVTSLIANIGVINNVPVGMFSLEMSSSQLGFRLVSAISKINYNRIRSGSLNDMEYEMYLNANDQVKKAPIYIDDTAGMNYIQLRAKATEMKLMHNVEIIFVDYVQLMSATGKKGQSREQEISEISRNLKLIAKDLNIPVIAISQLSRSVEIRGGKKRPELHDLRESGSLEQDADLVMFIYRPAYYKMKEDEGGEAFPEGYTELLIKKHRNGATGIVLMKFLEDSMLFTDSDMTARPSAHRELPKETGDNLLDDEPPF